MSAAVITASEGLELPHRRKFFGRFTNSPMMRVIGSRFITSIPVLAGVAFFTFLVMNALPGDTALALLGANATKQQIAQETIKLHLNQPFFERFYHWIQPIVAHGYFGASLSSGQSVGTVIAQRIPVTAELGAFALVISLVFAVPVAIIAARRPGGIVDRTNLVISMAGFSIPSFVLALVLVLIFAAKLGILPAIGFVPLSQSVGGNLRSLLLPAVSIGFGGFCGYSRFLRGDIVEQMVGQDYVLAAKAKGAGPWRVLLRHATRNSMIGFMTLLGLNLAGLVGGAVVIEQIFALPGIGQGLLLAINDRDVPLVEGLVLIFAVAVVLANLLTDLLYAVVDPRIRYGNANA
ncbi:MAG: ABC transporter permease [Acidimicrobiales bacterium]